MLLQPLLSLSLSLFTVIVAALVLVFVLVTVIIINFVSAVVWRRLYAGRCSEGSVDPPAEHVC